MPHIDTSGFSESWQCGGSEHRHRKGRRLSQSRKTRTNDSHMLLGDEKAANTFAFLLARTNCEGRLHQRSTEQIHKIIGMQKANGVAPRNWMNIRRHNRVVGR